MRAAVLTLDTYVSTRICICVRYPAARIFRNEIICYGAFHFKTIHHTSEIITPILWFDACIPQWRFIWLEILGKENNATCMYKYAVGCNKTMRLQVGSLSLLCSKEKWDWLDEYEVNNSYRRPWHKYFYPSWEQTSVKYSQKGNYTCSKWNKYLIPVFFF